MDTLIQKGPLVGEMLRCPHCDVRMNFCNDGWRSRISYETWCSQCSNSYFITIVPGGPSLARQQINANDLLIDYLYNLRVRLDTLTDDRQNARWPNDVKAVVLLIEEIEKIKQTLNDHAGAIIISSDLNQCIYCRQSSGFHARTPICVEGRWTHAQNEGYTGAALLCSAVIGLDS